MLSVGQLSERAEIATGHLEMILNGKDFPTMQELSRLADSLDTNVRDLLPPDNIDSSVVIVKHRSSESPRHFPS